MPEEKEHSGEYVIGEDGERHELKKRASIKILRNGSRLHDYIQVNVPAPKVWIAGLLSLGALFAMLWAGGDFLIGPRIERKIESTIREQTADLRRTMEKQNEQLELTRNQMNEILARMDTATASRWTLIDETIQSGRIEKLNPGINIPIPEHQKLPGEK